MVENNEYLQEWLTTRELLRNYDDRIHDLRKYGFSFITALLTAQSLLIVGPTGIPDLVKVVVIGITILLILALSFFEKSYQIIQEAAVERALIIERNLNLELTESISYFFEGEKAHQYKFYVYVLFVLGANLLAAAIITPYSSCIPLIIYIAVLFSVTLITLFLFRSTSEITLKSKLIGFTLFVFGANLLAVALIIPFFPFIPELIYIAILVSMSIVALFLINSIQIIRSRPSLDWGIDRVRCKKGDPVAITVTNIKNKTHKLECGTIFKIVEEDNPSGTPVFEKKVLNLEIRRKDSYTVLWDTNDPKVKNGTVYRVCIPHSKFILRRKIIVE